MSTFNHDLAVCSSSEGLWTGTAWYLGVDLESGIYLDCVGVLGRGHIEG